MFGIENLAAFILTAIVLVITPGIDTIMVLTRTITKGKKVGLYTTLGVCSGIIIHTLAATFGLSQILAQSALAFDVVKYLGAAYLMYIGYKAFTSKTGTIDLKGERIEKPQQKMKDVFFSAFLSSILNPKTAFFFLAFLPQFIKSSAIQSPIPYLVLGFIMFVIGITWCTFLAITGSNVATLFTKNKNIEHWLNKSSGLIFILLGIKIALTKR